MIDEGLLITEGIMPGLPKPAALIGIAEKGFLSVQLKVDATPGHSSMPGVPGSSAIAQMSAALANLDRQQMPGSIRGVAREMFEAVAPDMTGVNHIALTNLWLFGPVVQAMLERGPSTNAMLRTTTALTIMNAGNKDNVLPGRAEATVNFRLLPGDTRADVLQHVKSALPNDRFEISSLAGSAEPSPVSPTASASYQLIVRTVRSLFPDAVGGTWLDDRRHRFAPFHRSQRPHLPLLAGTRDGRGL